MLESFPVELDVFISYWDQNGGGQDCEEGYFEEWRRPRSLKVTRHLSISRLMHCKRRHTTESAVDLLQVSVLENWVRNRVNDI